jgi:hypothetical protein
VLRELKWIKGLGLDILKEPHARLSTLVLWIEDIVMGCEEEVLHAALYYDGHIIGA